MCILANHTGTENREFFVTSRDVSEHTIEFSSELVLTASKWYQSLNIMLNRPEIMPCVTFANMSSILIWIKVWLEYALIINRLHKSSSRIEHIAVVLRTLVIFIGDIGLAHLLCHFGNTEIVERIFQRTRQWPVFRVVLVGYVVRNVAILLVRTDATVFIDIGCCDASFQGLFCIKAANTLQVSIYNNRHWVVANHHIGFATPEVPYRQTAVLFVEWYERLHHVAYTFRLGISE